MHLSTNVKSYTKKDGTVIKTRRARYRCTHKVRRIYGCEGQTEYEINKLDNMISEVLITLFKDLKATPESELIEKRYQVELANCVTRLKNAKDELKKHTANLMTLQGEVVKAIQGTSDFDSSLLNDLILQKKNEISSVSQEIEQCDTELSDRKRRMNDIQTHYQQLISWAELFQSSTRETQKMIVSYLIESIKVRRGYEAEIKFNVTYEQFCMTNAS